MEEKTLIIIASRVDSCFAQIADMLGIESVLRKSTILEEKDISVLTCSGVDILIDFVNIDSENFSRDINQAIKRNKARYFCLIYQDVFPEEDFLAELISYNKSINNAGCQGILSDLTDSNFLYVTSEDESSDCVSFCPEEIVSGMLFFNSDVIERVGFFDTTISCKEQAIAQFCKRCAWANFINFYIPSQCCISTAKKITLSEETHEKVLRMAKANNLYISF